MPGNMTKAEALRWLRRYGATTRGYPQEVAAAYLGLGVRRFRDEVAAGRLPQPQQRGKRLIWDKLALDRYMDQQVDSGVCTRDHDPIMADIHAAQSSPLRPGDQS
jgi:hypothetical protein